MPRKKQETKKEKKKKASVKKKNEEEGKAFSERYSLIEKNPEDSEDLSPLEKARLRMREKRDAGETIERLNPIEKFNANPTRKTAMAAFCYECVGYLREEVRNCPSKNCPLWKWRPYQ